MRQKEFVYAVLATALKPAKAAAFVREHENNGDAQQVLITTLSLQLATSPQSHSPVPY